MSRIWSRAISAHWLHSFFGLTLSLFLGFLFLTGTLLVFAPELDWLRYREIRVAPQAEEKVSWGTIYDSAKAERPDWNVVRMVRSESPRFADNVVMLRPGEQTDRFIWADPFTAEIRGETSTYNFQNTLLLLHESLFIKGRKGKLIVTIFAIPLAVTVIAGLFLYRRFWTGFFRRPRLTGRGRAVLSDLHRLVAVWSLIFFIPLIATSIWYFVEHIGLDAPPVPIEKIEAQETFLPGDFDGKRLDEAVRLAEDALPGYHITSIILPRQKTQAIVFNGEHEAMLVRERANAVVVDPFTLDVLGVHRGKDMSVHQRISEAADPIHFGTWGGLASRIAWAVFGLGLTALVGMGIAIYALRIGAMEARKPTGPPRSGLVRAWRGMGPFGLGAWLSLALIGFGLAQVVYGFLS